MLIEKQYNKVAHVCKECFSDYTQALITLSESKFQIEIKCDNCKQQYLLIKGNKQWTGKKE